MRALIAATLASIALVGTYVALGGGGFEPSSPPSACDRRGNGEGDGVGGALQRVTLNALASTACELGVSRERLLLALAGEEQIGVDRERRTEAFRDGLRQAIDEEERGGRLGSGEAFLARQAIALLPVEALLEQLLSSEP